MISQEQWDAIRNRLMTDYHYHGGDALKQAMQDVQTLLMATKPYQLTIIPDERFQLTGTCMACMSGVCKRKESHT